MSVDDNDEEKDNQEGIDTPIEAIEGDEEISTEVDDETLQDNEEINSYDDDS